MAKQVIEYPFLDDDGSIGSYYVDPDTSQMVESLEDIDLSDLENQDDLQVINGYTGKPTTKDDPVPPKKKGFMPQAADNTGDRNPMSGKDAPRTEANNYGYVDAPRALDFAGYAPGPIGFAAKAGEAMINANNMESINTARQSMGLPSRSVIGGILSESGFKNSQGKVADVAINGKNYSVGLEAQDADKRTTLTPDEARTRGLMSNMKELSKDESKQAKKDFKNQKEDAPQFTAAAGPLDLPEPNVAGPPVGTVERADLPNVGEKQLSLSRNMFDMAKPLDETAKAIASPDVDANPVGHGLGLMGVSPTFADHALNGVNYSHVDRGPVTKGLTERSIETMNALASNTPGGINVTSAYRDPAVNAAVGGAKSSLHQQGAAFDVSTHGLNDQQKRDMVERGIMSGAMELGTYKDQSLHFASQQRVAPLDPELTGGVTAMYNRTRMDLDQAPDWFKDGVEVSRLAPTPQERPDPTTIPGFMNTIQTNPVDLKSISATPQTGVSWNDEDKNLAARTLAGELDLSKTDLTTEDGRKEAYGIMSTIDNRVSKYGSVQDTVKAPAQYSTWNNPASAAVAQKNFDLNPQMYNGLVDGYLSDPKTNNLGYTSYHANTVNPGWSADMNERTVIGAHTFGTLPEYQTKAIDNLALTNTVAPTTAFNPSTPAQPASVGFMSSQPQTATTQNQPAQSTTTDTSKSTTSNESSGNGSSGMGGVSASASSTSNAGASAHGSADNDKDDDHNN